MNTTHSRDTNCVTLRRNFLGRIVVNPGITIRERGILNTGAFSGQGRPPELLNPAQNETRAFQGRCVRRSPSTLLSFANPAKEYFLVKVEVRNKRYSQLRLEHSPTDVTCLGLWLCSSWKSGVHYYEGLYMVFPDGYLTIVEEHRRRVLHTEQRRTKVSFAESSTPKLLTLP